MRVDIGKLKPLGVILILGCAVLALIVCFTADMGIPERVTPEHETSYYTESAEHMEELKTEIEEKLFSQIDGDIFCEVDETDMVLSVTASKKVLPKAQVVAERDYDKTLFRFKVR